MNHVHHASRSNKSATQQSAYANAPDNSRTVNQKRNFFTTSPKMAATYTGSCKCAAIRIEITGEPAKTSLCHCENCKKYSGSAYSANAIFPKSAFTIVAGEPKVYETPGGSGNVTSISFCGNCGCTMWSESPTLADLIIVKIGVLDGDAMEKLKPRGELFTKRRPGWLGDVDGAVQMEAGH
ncbi:hypothetical protein BT63DRAFT_458111 [Microthyrium microscopicum]|uniref:CENP-V/GFA domain-containing protein n=1 Tax=Microthyrium microscopicum TaxID=703497 RepID=A0A6A6U4C9_9PEZI|nr:hypothetical protein BT63DRAFT_458111 [Microthyrium microscopicum]